MSELDDFRTQAREWLASHCPESLRSGVKSTDDLEWGGRRAQGRSDDKKLWLDRMAEQGWVCPSWPVEYGGAGLDAEHARVLSQELRRIDAVQPLLSFGIAMLAPVLMEYGNEDQKRRFLPDIAAGRTAWCQGYSEPGAGSDLAGLQTRAADRGDHYLVNGQKIWTSYADKSDWIFCLVRTDPSAAKHDGISFLLFDMTSPGISVSPISLISGNSPFCQTFFQDVEVPKDQLVGPLNGGWTIAKRLLQHEREMISSLGGVGTSARSERRNGPVEIARRYCGEIDGRIADPLTRDQITRLRMDERCFGAAVRRSAEQAKAGMPMGPASSMFKLYGTELNKRRHEVLVEIMGAKALGWEGAGFSEAELHETREWLRSKGNSIEGGTTEIQLNVIAKRVLGLPD